MVMSCCAYNCNQRNEKNSNPKLSFHSFPVDETLRKKWIAAVRRDKWKPSASSRLCSLHFNPDSYQHSGWSRKASLNADAVPTIFDFPKHLKSEVSTRPYPRERNSGSPNIVDKPQDHQVVENQYKPTLKKRKHYLGDFKGEIQSLDEAVKCIAVSEKLIQHKNNQIKILKQRNRRLMKKITSLKTLISNFKSKHLMLNKATQ